MLKINICVLAVVASVAVLGAQGGAPQTPAPAAAAAPGPPPLDPTKPHKLEVTTGSKARFRVQEQLVGINFPNEAVGTTEAVTGTLWVNPDGSPDPARSKIMVDLRTLTSDQAARDNYLQRTTLETAKYPFVEFVPRRAVGLPAPLPGTGPQANAGFQLIGDMTIRGVTSEATWNVVAVFSNDLVAGRATTTLLFPAFNIPKPSIARLVSVDDKIQLEVEFRAKRSLM